MLCTPSGLLQDNKRDILKAFSKGEGGVSCGENWKTDAVATRNIDTSSWVDELRGTQQEKMVEQALNLDLGNLSHKQLIDFFIQVTEEPECKAQKYIYEADNNLIVAFQNFFDNQNKRELPEKAPSPESSCEASSSGYGSKRRQQRDSFSKECDHRCCMVHAETCCSCSDARPITDCYDIYIQDEGYCITPYRWLFYCPVCKRRTQAESPPRERGGTYAPLYRPKSRTRTCSKHKVCPASCSRHKDTCVIC